LRFALLFEHKSYRERAVFRQLQEKIEAIRGKLGSHAIIVPFVFYQHETPWLYIFNYRDESPEELEELARRIKEEKVRRIMMTTAEMLIEKGKREGIEKGIEKGIKRGRREGKLEAARNLLENGVSLEIVLKSTGFTRQQLIQAGIIKGG